MLELQPEPPGLDKWTLSANLQQGAIFRQDVVKLSDMRCELLELLRIRSRELSSMLQPEPGPPPGQLRHGDLHQLIERRSRPRGLSFRSRSGTVDDKSRPAASVDYRPHEPNRGGPTAARVVGNPPDGTRLCVHLLLRSGLLASPCTAEASEADGTVCDCKVVAPAPDVAGTARAVRRKTVWVWSGRCGERRNQAHEAAECGRGTSSHGDGEAASDGGVVLSGEEEAGAVGAVCVRVGTRLAFCAQRGVESDL